MAILAVDYGRARIGLAISLSGIVANPLETIKNKGDARNASYLISCCDKLGVTQILFGVALNKEGFETPMSAETRRFAEWTAGEFAKQNIKMEFLFHPEYLSSWEAEEYIKNVMGVRKPEKIKEILDAVSASVILQRHIDKLKEHKK